MPDIVWFEGLSRQEVPLAGGKGANLGELLRAGVRVPPGFVVTADAYRAFLRDPGLVQAIERQQQQVEVDGQAALQAASESLQAMVRSQRFPEPLRQEILNAYQGLARRVGPSAPFVAVRSSATVEDSCRHSFAGMFRSFLNVRGGDDLLRRIQDCWASLYGARVLYYRIKQGQGGADQTIAVVIQEMVKADKAGVFFTADPASGDPNLLVIESTWGLGEPLVEGQVLPDRYLVDKRTLEILDRSVVDKELEVTLDPITGASVRRAVPPGRVNAPSLSDVEIRALAELGRRLEEHFHGPQDAEFAIEGGQIFLVQTRPMTTPILSPVKRPRPGLPVPLVRGLGASPGFAVGSVRVLRSPEEGDKLAAGEVLVAPMASPDWVSIVPRAVAFITDSGGMTSYAAIVSRELGMPCIVGSRTATQVLKDGMQVSVSATEGVVYQSQPSSGESRPHPSPDWRSLDVNLDERARAQELAERPVVSLEIDAVMSHRAVGVDANDTLEEAAGSMRAHVVGIMPVLSHGTLVGVVTDRDLAVRAVARGLDPRQTRVREVMTPDPVTCLPRESVEVAAALLQRHGIRRLVVVDESLLPIGILSVDDLALYPETGALSIQVLSHAVASRATDLDGVLDNPHP